jgi:hypothetical protein
LIVNRVSIDHIIEAVEHDGSLGIGPSAYEGLEVPDLAASILTPSGRATS